MVAVEILAVLLGSLAVIAVLLSAVRTVVVPRDERVLLTELVFLVLRWPFVSLSRRARSEEGRERMIARYAPVSLMVLPAVWAIAVISCFVPIYWGLGVRPLREAATVSGSSFTTLGFARTEDLPTLSLSVLEALLGLGLVALLISFLPTMYSHFANREAAVSKLVDRSGSPPDPVQLFARANRIGWLHDMDDLWAEWENVFVELEESHTSYPALSFFRSPQADRSWVTASGALLDAASLYASTIATARAGQCELCILAGYIALRRISDHHRIAYDPYPAPDDPVTVTREEWDDLVARLEAEGVPLRADRDQSWRDFAGWRVNYDAALVGLAELTLAPRGIWSSDRLEGRGPVGRR